MPWKCSAPWPGECHAMSLVNSDCTVSMSPAWNDSYTRWASALLVRGSVDAIVRSYRALGAASRHRWCNDPTPNRATARDARADERAASTASPSAVWASRVRPDGAATVAPLLSLTSDRREALLAVPGGHEDTVNRG